MLPMMPHSRCDSPHRCSPKLRTLSHHGVRSYVVQIVDALLEFIEANPAKSKEWKAQADAKLASQEDA